jgi:hypothetical protein
MSAIRDHARRGWAGPSAACARALIGLLAVPLLTAAPASGAATGAAGDASGSRTSDALEAPEGVDLPGTKAERVDDDSTADDGSLIAALTELPLPRYTTPATSAALGWARHFGAVRSGEGSGAPSVLAPRDHVGLTSSQSPRLWWRLAEDTPHALQITLVDEAAIDPVFRVELAGPHAGGLDSIDLRRRGVTLEPGIEYRWFVAVQVDPERPSRNPTAAGAVERLPSGDDRVERALRAEGARRGHALAELGLWYDAFDFFARAAATRPNEARVTRHRDHLATWAQVR